MLSEAEREEYHLRLARLMIRILSKEELADELFDLVAHFSRYATPQASSLPYRAQSTPQSTHSFYAHILSTPIKRFSKCRAAPPRSSRTPRRSVASSCGTAAPPVRTLVACAYSQRAS